MKRVIVVLGLAACSRPVGSPAGSSEEGKPAGPAASAPAVAAPAAAAPDGQLARMGYSDDTTGSPDKDCPGATDGHELIGTEPREWQFAEWANTNGAPMSLHDLRGRVVVVRFWTTGCPFCEKTMPALQRLSEELRDQPVTVVGAFHAKPESSQRDLGKPREVTRTWGVTFPLAIDREWRTLRSWWLDSAHRHATSVTFVIGKDGRVAHIHPGPEYYPTDDPSDTKANGDYLALRAAVVAAASK
jgi:peroxiredoxin